MNVPEVKKLVENFSMHELIAAEEALIDDTELPMRVGGEDDGEKLTHILAAIFILEKMKSGGVDFKEALREYTRTVRESFG